MAHENSRSLGVKMTQMKMFNVHVNAVHFTNARAYIEINLIFITTPYVRERRHLAADPFSKLQPKEVVSLFLTGNNYIFCSQFSCTHPCISIRTRKTI